MRGRLSRGDKEVSPISLNIKSGYPSIPVRVATVVHKLRDLISEHIQLSLKIKFVK